MIAAGFDDGSALFGGFRVADDAPASGWPGVLTVDRDGAGVTWCVGAWCDWRVDVAGWWLVAQASETGERD